jgi:hypothetical protein
MVDEPGRIMRMLTTPSINARTWKQAPCWACMVLLTLYVYYTPGWGKAQTWKAGLAQYHLKTWSLQFYSDLVKRSTQVYNNGVKNYLSS